LQNGDLLSALAIPLPLWDGPLSEVPSGAQGVQGQPQQKPNTKERTRMRATTEQRTQYENCTQAAFGAQQICETAKECGHRPESGLRCANNGGGATGTV